MQRLRNYERPKRMVMMLLKEMQTEFMISY